MISLSQRPTGFAEVFTADPMDSPTNAAAASAIANLRRLMRAMRASSSPSDRTAGVTTAQLYLLQQLAAEPDQSVGDLARRTMTTQSSVSEVLARLVDHGFIVRRAATDDRRRAEHSLTPRGRAVLATTHDAVQERLLDAFARLPRDQQSCLATGMADWVAEAKFDGVR